MNNITGKRIAERRQQLSLSQSQLAERLGYSDKTAISKIENGISQLNQSKIIAFADALQTTPAYLMGWIDDPDMTRNEMYLKERIEKAKMYIFQWHRMLDEHKNGKIYLPEELIVAEEYKKAPQHIKDAIKAMLQIQTEGDK